MSAENICMHACWYIYESARSATSSPQNNKQANSLAWKVPSHHRPPIHLKMSVNQRWGPCMSQVAEKCIRPWGGMFAYCIIDKGSSGPSASLVLETDGSVSVLLRSVSLQRKSRWLNWIEPQCLDKSEHDRFCLNLHNLLYTTNDILIPSSVLLQNSGDHPRWTHSICAYIK